jgi:hypothetical protein
MLRRLKLSEGKMARALKIKKNLKDVDDPQYGAGMCQMWVKIQSQFFSEICFSTCNNIYLENYKH